MLNRSYRDPRGGASKKRFLLFFFGILLVVISVGSFFLVLSNWEKARSQATVAEMVPEEAETESIPDLFYEGEAYYLNPNIETTLVMGIDKTQEDIEEHDKSERRNDQQSDFLVLIIQDTVKGTSKFLQINRDTMVDVPVLGYFGDVLGTKNEQIALAHSYGHGEDDSCRNAAKAVSSLLGGIHIDHYISLTMDAVAKINDAIGGVPVEITEDFSNTDPSLVKGTTVNLMGDQALIYVRARRTMDEPTNISRMERQTKYLNSFYNQLGKFLSKSSEGTQAKLLMDISPYMVTDLSSDDLLEILSSSMNTGNLEMISIEGESVRGTEYMEFYPDEDQLQKSLISLFYN